MKRFIAFVAILSIPINAPAQSLISGTGTGKPRKVMPFDSGILDLGEPRNDLPCWAAPFKPELGFDLLFQTGYQVSIPLKQLAGADNVVTIIFRVVSAKRKDDPIYFTQSFRVPAIDDEAQGNAMLEGAFLVGEGVYRVDWLLRDHSGRVCARFWDLEARAGTKEGGVVGDIARDVVRPVEATPFEEESPVRRDQIARPLNVKVIVNFAPQDLEANTLGQKDLSGLVSILRRIGRESRISTYSIVACSLQSQQVIYRQESAPKIDLPALGKALDSITLAKVDVKQLALKNGETAFLSTLVASEMTKDHPDGLIFVSPKYPLNSDVPPEVIERLKAVDYPVFYLNYNLDPLAFPWRDAIGKLIRQLHGLEYRITRPQDLLKAWPDIISRIVKMKDRG